VSPERVWFRVARDGVASKRQRFILPSLSMLVAMQSNATFLLELVDATQEELAEASGAIGATRQRRTAAREPPQTASAHDLPYACR
jgi:hypothetical protein